MRIFLAEASIHRQEAAAPGHPLRSPSAAAEDRNTVGMAGAGKSV
ncbi:hypothetical protein [Streptomonospora alba]|nr:hypothetical protein [Streptomonospora alba]